MDELKTLYSVTNKIIENSQVGNYFPPKIYTDVAKLKYMRQKEQSKYAKDKPRKKLDLNCKKGTFLQQIQRRETKLPSPQSYKPQQLIPQYKKRKFSNLPSRITILNQMIKQKQRNPTPSPNHYQPLKKKCISLASFSKAENTNYLDAVVYNSTMIPGTGQYNPRSSGKMIELGKFDKAERLKCKSNKQNVFPDSATYHPKIPSKFLFSQIQKQKSQKPKFNQQKRFQDLNLKNSNKTLFYTGISEWGMKTNYKKKDILSTLSTHNIYSKSVYYH